MFSLGHETVVPVASEVVFCRMQKSLFHEVLMLLDDCKCSNRQIYGNASHRLLSRTPGMATLVLAHLFFMQLVCSCIDID
jgi:hypothetical protein